MQNFRSPQAAEIQGQQTETERLDLELQKFQVSQHSQLRSLRQQQTLEQEIEAGQRQQLAMELDALCKDQSRGAEEQMQSSIMMNDLQRQLVRLQQNLEEERNQRMAFRK